MITSRMKTMKLPHLVVLTLLVCGAVGATGQEDGRNQRRAGGEGLEACEERMEGILRNWVSSMERLKECRQKLSEAESTLRGTERWNRRSRVPVRDHRGEVDVWDEGVSVSTPGEREEKAGAQALQPPAKLPKRREVLSWLEEYNTRLGDVVREAWSPEEYRGFFEEEDRHCQGDLYCQLSARQQVIALAVSGR